MLFLNHSSDFIHGVMLNHWMSRWRMEVARHKLYGRWFEISYFLGILEPSDQEYLDPIIVCERVGSPIKKGGWEKRINVIWCAAVVGVIIECGVPTRNQSRAEAFSASYNSVSKENVLCHSRLQDLRTLIPYFLHGGPQFGSVRPYIESMLLPPAFRQTLFEKQ